MVSLEFDLNHCGDEPEFANDTLTADILTRTARDAPGSVRGARKPPGVVVGFKQEEIVEPVM